MEIMIVGGVHLDRAWTGLNAEFGSVLREWSRTVLVRVIDEANRRNAEMLVIAGDLFHRSYALPAAVDYASRMLGTFNGSVLVVPGRSDWYDDTSLYSTQRWASNIQISSSSEYQRNDVAPSVWTSAWTSPGGSSPRIPVASEPRVLIRPGMSGNVDGVLTVPELVYDPREPGGYALLINSEQLGAPARKVDLHGQPGLSMDLDITDATTTDALAATLEKKSTTGRPLLLRLMGTLAPGVLLPGFGGAETPPDVMLDLESLVLALPSVDDTDRSARAEFIRGMLYADISALQQHQTIALGLAALDASAQGV